MHFERQLKRIDSRMDVPKEVKSVFKEESVLNAIEVIDFIYFVDKDPFYETILEKVKEWEGGRFIKVLQPGRNIRPKSIDLFFNQYILIKKFGRL